MVSAKGVLRTEGFRYALDNGAWTAHQQNQPFDEGAFEKAVEKLGERADFIVVPDIVAGGIHSLRFSESWLQRLTGINKLLLIPVQDEMTIADVRPFINPEVGIFIGGTTHFKESTMFAWGCLARERKAYVHCGRINSQRKVKLCQMNLMNSFDGSGASKWILHAKTMNAAYRQRPLSYGT